MGPSLKFERRHLGGLRIHTHFATVGDSGRDLQFPLERGTLVKQGAGYVKKDLYFNCGDSDREST